MNTVGWIVVGLVVLSFWSWIVFIIRWLPRKMLERIFRQYEDWQLSNTPKGALRISCLCLNSDGGFDMRVDSHTGYWWWQKVTGKETVKEIIDRIAESAPKEIRGDSFALRFDDLTIVLPAPAQTDEEEEEKEDQ